MSNFKQVAVRLTQIEYENLKLISQKEKQLSHVTSMSMNQMARIFICEGIEKYFSENDMIGKEK